MKLFLIRHGETEHNIAGLLAGVTDSNLTHHGVLQTQRLARYLVKDRELHFTHVYASDLTRAFMTADEIRKAHNKDAQAEQIEIVRLQLLREQDFGSLELVPWNARRDPHAFNSAVPSPGDPTYKAKETVQAMKYRADSFLEDFITPLFAVDESPATCVAIVSHGIFLGTLWRALLSRLKFQNVILDPSLAPADGDTTINLRPGWSNTGFVEVDIAPRYTSRSPSIHSPATNSRLGEASSDPCDESREVNTDEIRHSPTCQIKRVSPAAAVGCEPLPVNSNKPDLATTQPLQNMAMTIRVINGKNHLSNFKRARGGLGSLTFDKRQTKLEGFFKKTKLESKGHNRARPRKEEAI